MSGAGSALPAAGTAAPVVPPSPWAMFFVASIAVFLVSIFQMRGLQARDFR